MARKPAESHEEPPQKVLSTSETSSELSTSVAKEALLAIRQEIREIVAGKPLAGEDGVTRIAVLAQKAALVAAEQRKAEKEERDAIREITPAVMLAWARMQTPELRARIRRDIEAIDGGGRKSVLGS